MTRKFTCESCGRELESKWTEEEAQAEAISNFGALPEPDDRAVICDDCYGPFILWYGLFYGQTDGRH